MEIISLLPPAANAPRTRRVALRADDAGSSPDITQGILDAVRAGTVQNVSVMAPPPDFPAAAALLRDLSGLDLGLHVTLNCEWAGLGWRPVLPPERVPSLVDPGGRLWPTPQVLHGQNPVLAEMLTEVRAQLGRLRDAGLHVAYLDEHMNVGWLPGLRDALRQLADEEFLAVAADAPVLASLQTAVPDVAGFLAAADAGEESGQVILHPARDGAAVRAWHEPGQAAGVVARHRVADRAFLLDPRLRDACESGRVRPALLSHLAREFRADA